MAPLRIVVVMIEPPLPFGNAAARWFYVLMKGLTERGHRVTAFATCVKPRELDEARALFPAPDHDLRLYPYPPGRGWRGKLKTLRQPYSYMFSDRLRHDIEAELAAGFDILHLEQLWSGWVGLRHRDKALINVHHLVGIDLEEAPTTSIKEWASNRLMFRTEQRLARKYHYIRSCSPRLVEPMRRFNPGAEITTVPVGIDAGLYEFIPDERRRGNAPIVTLIGSMYWYPGRSAARRLVGRLWPEIKRRVPEARLRIVGWSARSALREFLDLPDVEILENVPDIQPYFEQTSVFLYAPSRGSGMKIKVLEAMSFGVPVVTTSEGAEGLPAVDGVHLGLCEDDAGLIERTVTLLNEPERQDRQRRAARALIESHCGPGPTLDAIEAIYGRMRGAER